MAEERISVYLSYKEGTKSDTAIRKGIENVPSLEQLRAMGYVGRNVFDPLRARVGGPLYVPSFFRSPKLNAAIGGAKKSQHLKGEAIDIDCDRYGGAFDNRSLFFLVREEFLFDQLIWEFGDENSPAWVHVSGVDPVVAGRANRGDVLRAVVVNGKTGYVKFDL